MKSRSMCCSWAGIRLVIGAEAVVIWESFRLLCAFLSNRSSLWSGREATMTRSVGEAPAVVMVCSPFLNVFELAGLSFESRPHLKKRANTAKPRSGHFAVEIGCQRQIRLSGRALRPPPTTYKTLESRRITLAYALHRGV